jgi:hypothetical protein
MRCNTQYDTKKIRSYEKSPNDFDSFEQAQQ